MPRPLVIFWFWLCVHMCVCVGGVFYSVCARVQVQKCGGQRIATSVVPCFPPCLRQWLCPPGWLPCTLLGILLSSPVSPSEHWGYRCTSVSGVMRVLESNPGGYACVARVSFLCAHLELTRDRSFALGLRKTVMCYNQSGAASPVSGLLLTL